MKVRISKRKFENLNTCCDERGVIAALAVDHRGNLLQAIAQARGAKGTASEVDMLAFKKAVTKVLTPFASAILLDPQYGLGAIASRAPGKGVMLAYEKSGYDVTDKDRMPDLLPEWSVRRLVEAGANAIKILLYYNPLDKLQVNTVKQAYIERIGAECEALEVPFFLEPLVYDATIGNETGLAFAQKKPLYVTQVMDEFSKPRYGVDILKVELPVNPAFVGGTAAFAGGEVAYSRQEALELFRVAARAASKPFIFLSGGVSDEVFCEMLELVAEAGVKYSGVLCGRATWQDAIPIYAKQDLAAMEAWLAERGRLNIESVNAVLAQGAFPWWDAYGGKDNIEVIEPGNAAH